MGIQADDLIVLETHNVQGLVPHPSNHAAEVLHPHQVLGMRRVDSREVSAPLFRELAGNCDNFGKLKLWLHFFEVLNLEVLAVELYFET